MQFDERTVLDSDGVLALEKVPNSMVVVGAGIIGIEYASMFAALGTRVTVIDKRPAMLEMCDPEVAESLKFHLRDLSVSFRFGEEVAGRRQQHARHRDPAGSGKRIAADAVMYSAGRQGQTDALDLAAAGLSADSRGRIEVDDQYRTTVPHIFAVGDVIGFPALAATSMDQGRLAAYHAFDEPARELAVRAAHRHLHDPRDLLLRPHRGGAHHARRSPTRSASRATASWRAARSSATPTGCSSSSCTPRRASCWACTSSGRSATDLVHIGQAIMACGGTVDYLVDTVLNYPTLSEAYKVAALDATNKIRQVARFSQ